MNHNRIFRSLFYLCSFAVVLLFSACDGDDPVIEESTNFPSEISRIVTNNCATSGCHSQPNPQENLDLSSWETMFNGSDIGATIIPYDPDWSHIFQHMNTFEDLGFRATPVMPPAPSPEMSREDVILVKEWIENGAKDKDGNYYYADREITSEGKVFVLCANSDRVGVIDIKTNLMMHYVKVGQLDGVTESPHFIQLSPDNQYFYITLIQGGLIEKYRTDNYAFEGRLSVGPDPAIIRLSPDGSKLVVTHWNDNTSPKISIVNTADMSIHQQIQGDGLLLSFGHGIATSADFRTFYITAEWGNYYSKYKLDETFTIVEEEKIPLNPNDPLPQPTQNYGPYQAQLSPDGSLLFITCNREDLVRVYNTSNDQLVAYIPVGEYPRLMTVNETTNQLFVACRFEKNTQEQGSLEGCVSVIDMNTLTETNRIYRVGHRPHGVAIDASRGKLYVSSENTGGVVPPHHPIDGNSFPPGHVNVVDLSTLQVNPDLEVEVAEFPNAVMVIE